MRGIQPSNTFRNERIIAKMKVTIAFGYTRVVVPSQSTQTVHELMQQASYRYLKLLNKNCHVFKLETSDGALLCGDDLVQDVVDDKEILVAVYDEEEETLEDTTSHGLMSPYCHPRLAGEASLGLSPIQNPNHQRLQEEPATSSPLNSIAEISTFSRGGMNKSRHSLRSSEFDFEKFRAENSYENRDDEGFYSDATISVYFQHSTVLKITRTRDEMGINFCEWKSSRSDGAVLGLKVASIEHGKRAHREKFFTPGDGILEVNNVTLATGTLSSRNEFVQKAFKEPSLVLRVVTQDVIQEIESLESSLMSDDPREEQLYESSNFELNAAKNVINANRRTGRWKKFEIEVFKGTSGLGFTLASRDTALTSNRGETPMIVNRILPDSAAQSSDLQIGDKLLTINGDNISSLSQAQVVKLLKACPSGAPVLLGVSRQVRKQRKSPEETEEEEDRFTVNSKVLEMFKGATEVCSFNISMENTSLGIQLKGTQQNNSSLSGLFVDKILTTGAAFKDGRIKENDRILAINNHSLHGYDNETALEIIRQNLSSNSRSEVYIKVERPKTAVKKSLSYPNSFVISKPHSPRKTDSLPRQFNDSYIMATQHGIRTFSLDSGKSGINRSQSLHECNSSHNKQINKCDSISYIECSIDSEESDPLAFERESSMRKSFHENRKQSNSPPAKFFNMYDAYRKKKNGPIARIVRGLISSAGKKKGPAQERLAKKRSASQPDVSQDFTWEPSSNHSPRSRSIERNRRATEGNKVHKRYQAHSSASPSSSLQSSRRSSSSSRGRESSSENYGSQNGFEKSQLLRRSASSDRASLSRASTSGISSLGASNSARSSPLAPCSYDPVRERPTPRDRPARQLPQSGRHFYAHFSEEDRRRYDQIRKATVDMGRKKVESQEKINDESRNGNDAPNLRALSGKYLPIVTDTCRDPKYPTIGRVKMTNRYRSPGTISCQDFRPHQPTSARPFFTPGASTPKSAETKRSNSVNRRIDYDAVPRSLGPSISRSKVI